MAVKNICENIACRPGTTIGLLSPAGESLLAVCIYLTKTITKVVSKATYYWICSNNLFVYAKTVLIRHI